MVCTYPSPVPRHDSRLADSAADLARQRRRREDVIADVMLTIFIASIGIVAVWLVLA